MTTKSVPGAPAPGSNEGSGPTIPEDVAALGYEDAKDELIRVVARLESGGEPLEASLALWERGEALAAQCQRRLDGARERLEQVRASRTAPTTTTEDDE
ncbi:exodeoxyribonuclease VII small subunit [Cellulomonas sp. PhB143]|uniref:exodeoxyribonuclease VII small subunit n=1 Tax=Cellulomonas sp. PhB143 TaxID=2485186 RepID=UPI000F495972|nr:exodeoxyribonuclease VII small subunit [Cellulomonas sp. PhB143]ROS76907.1 exodeoxyribonuclease VII small subunit [Cellulomonas sp. PhB143]